MRLALGAPVRCSDGAQAGRLEDVVVDPIHRRVTHVVVRARRGAEPARLVPFALAESAAPGGELSLRCTCDELARLEPTQDFALLSVGERPDAGDGWDVGVEDDIPVPPYEGGEVGDYLGVMESTVGVAYDRIPKGTVELRRSSVVEWVDGRTAGHLEAVEVDGDAITRISFPRGHLWWRREIGVPVESVAELATDTVVVSTPGSEL